MKVIQQSRVRELKSALPYTGLTEYSAQYNEIIFNPLSANPTKWSNTLKQFADELFECVLTILWGWRLRG